MRLKVGTKLYAGFGIVIAGMTVGGLFGLTQLNSVVGQATVLYTENLRTETKTGILRRDMLLMREQILQYPLAPTDRLSEVADDMRRLEGEIADDLEALRSQQGLTERQVALLDDTEIAIADWYRARDAGPVAETDAGNRDGAASAALYGIGGQAFREAFADIGEFAEETSSTAAAAHDAAVATNNSTTIISIALVIAIATIAAGVAIWLAGGISRAARTMADAAKRIAEKDLTALATITAAIADGDATQSVEFEFQEIEVTSSDEMGELAQSFNRMIVRLRETGQSFARMLARLSELKERAELYLDVAGVMLAFVDTDGRITMINRRGCEILGHSESDLTGRDWFDSLIPISERKNRRRAFRNIVEGKADTTAGEYRLLAADGKELLVAIHDVVVREPDGEITGVLVSGEDVTELRRTQEQLRHSQLLATLGEMTAGMAHEMNNPLGSILLYSELMISGDIPEGVTFGLKVVHSEAKRAAKIMTDLLTYGRGVKPRKRTLDLRRVLSKVLAMRRYHQRVSDITVETDLPAEPLLVKADGAQLTQVFVNLLLNAEQVLAVSDGGKITVSGKATRGWAIISIADNGTGIPPDDLKRVFYPFFTDKKQWEGTGLGLSTCHGILAEHDGLIRAENNDMGGATFTVELPLFLRQSVLRHPETQSVRQTDAGKRIPVETV